MYEEPYLAVPSKVHRVSLAEIMAPPSLLSKALFKATRAQRISLFSNNPNKITFGKLWSPSTSFTTICKSARHVWLWEVGT